MKKALLVVFLFYSAALAGVTINLHRYMWANYKQFEGNAAEAQKWYEQIFSTNRYSIFSNKGYLHFLHNHGNHQRIVALFPKLEEPFKHDADIQLIFVIALKKTNHLAQADDKLIQLSRMFKTHPEIIFQATETLVRRKEMNNALSLVDDYLNEAPRRPNNFIFYFLKSQIFMQMQDFKQAHIQIKECLEAHPRFPQGWLLLAMIEEQQGKINDAIKGYQSYLEVNGPNKQIEHHLFELTFKQKNAQNNHQLLFVNQSNFQKAVMLYERKQYAAALQQLNNCLIDTPNDMQMRLLKVQILSAMDNIDELLKTVTSWIAQEPDNQAWYQTLHLLSRTQLPINRLITALNAIHTRHPNQLFPLLYLADLHTRINMIEKAMDYYYKAKEIITDPAVKMRTMHQLAMLHYEREEYDKIPSLINAMDELSVDYAPAHNLSAYYYATAGNDLETAQRYLDKAYAQERGNPHFLDTQAVIYYKKQNYDKALKLLEPLAQKMAHDSSVLIHLAKTYYKLSKIKQAHTIIDQAQQYAQTDYERKTSAILAYRWKRK